MRDNLERVTIVLTKEQHKRFKEYSRKFHGSLSQFLRLAGENETDEGKKADMFDLRPIIKKLEANGNLIQQMEDRLKKTEKGTDYIVGKLGNNVDKIADNVEELLLHKGKLSIPEMGNYLPYTQEEIISAVERLEERFAIVSIKRLSSPSKWNIRGDDHDD